MFRGRFDAAGIIDLIDPFCCFQCLIYSRFRLLPVELYPQMLNGISKILIESKDRTELFIKSYDLLVDLLGYDPYYEARRKLDEEALEYIKHIPRNISINEMALYLALSNGADIEMRDYNGNLDLNLDTEYKFGDYNKVVNDIANAERVALVVDNVGEALIDVLLTSKLQNMGIQVTLIARKFRYEVDATVDDIVRYLKMLNINLEVMGIESRYSIFHDKKLTEKLAGCSNIVLVKGICNLESFISIRPEKLKDKCIFLFRAKCKPLSKMFNVKLGQPLIAYGNEILDIYYEFKCQQLCSISRFKHKSSAH